MNFIRRLALVALTGAALLATCLIGSSSPPTATLPESGTGIERIYHAKCAICHAADGSGTTALGKKLKLRALGSPEVQKQADAQLYEVIGKGKGKMPGYEKSLDEAKIRALVAYIRQPKKKGE